MCKRSGHTGCTNTHTPAPDQPCPTISSVPTGPSWVLGGTLPGWINTKKVKTARIVIHQQVIVKPPWLRHWSCGEPEWSVWWGQKNTHEAKTEARPSAICSWSRRFTWRGSFLPAQFNWIPLVREFRRVWGDNSDRDGSRILEQVRCLKGYLQWAAAPTYQELVSKANETVKDRRQLGFNPPTLTLLSLTSHCLSVPHFVYYHAFL